MFPLTKLLALIGDAKKTSATANLIKAVPHNVTVILLQLRHLAVWRMMNESILQSNPVPGEPEHPRGVESWSVGKAGS
jgi:hypothetical protein